MKKGSYRLNLAILEVGRYNQGEIDNSKFQWLNFFSNKPFEVEVTIDEIKQADESLTQRKMGEKRYQEMVDVNLQIERCLDDVALREREAKKEGLQEGVESIMRIFRSGFIPKDFTITELRKLGKTDKEIEELFK